MNDDVFSKKIAEAANKVKSLNEKVTLEKNAIVQMSDYFERNLAALDKYFPKLADYFLHYQGNKLQLFVTESGQINAYDKVNHAPIYSDSPAEQTDKHVERFLDQPLVTSAYYRRTNNPFNSIHEKYINQMIDVTTDIPYASEPADRRPEFIGTLIVVGCGLGYPLPALFSKVEIQLTILFEPDPDMFYTSLHVIDWAGILDFLNENNRSIYINVGSDAKTIGKDMYNYLRYHSISGICGTFIYEHAPTLAISDTVKELRSQFSHYIGGWGFFDDAIIGLSHFYHNLLSAPAVLAPNLITTPNVARTAMIVGNGPSLDDAIEVIKKYREQLVVFSCGSASTALYKAGIVPDFHAEIERLQLTYNRLAELPESYLKQITLLAGNVVHPKCVELFKSVVYCLKANEAASSFFIEKCTEPDQFSTLKFCNPVCSNTGAAFAAAMGFKQIVLAGVDCGFIDEGYHHSKRSAYYSDKGEEKVNILNLAKGGAFPVPGNLRDEIMTTTVYDYSRFALDELVAMYPETVFVNISDGAKIQGAVGLEPEAFVPLSDEPVSAAELDGIIAASSRKSLSLTSEELLQRLNIPAYNVLIDFLIDKISGDFSSQEEVILTLESMQAAINQYRDTERHIFNCLEGSFAYYAVFARQVVYLTKREQRFDVVRQVSDMFIHYLQESRELFNKAFDHVDMKVWDMSAFRPS